MFVSGGWEGSMHFWKCGNQNPIASMEAAHESSVFALDWHPLGHILASGSNDHTTRFWTRNRPGDPMNDRFNLSKEEADAMGLVAEEALEEITDTSAILPGLGGFSSEILPGLGSGNTKARPNPAYTRGPNDNESSKKSTWGQRFNDLDQGKSAQGSDGKRNNRDNRDRNGPFQNNQQNRNRNDRQYLKNDDQRHDSRSRGNAFQSRSR
jgi:polyadenylation factor subunit 2